MQIKAILVDKTGAKLAEWSDAPEKMLDAEKIEIKDKSYVIEKVVLTDNNGPVYRIETKAWSEPKVDFGEAVSVGVCLAILFWGSFWILFTNPDQFLGIVAKNLGLMLFIVGALLTFACVTIKSRYLFGIAFSFSVAFLLGAFLVFNQIVFNDPLFSIPDDLSYVEVGKIVRTESENVIAFFWSFAPWIGIAIAALGSKIVSGVWGAFYKFKPKSE